jgi:hypothetical protein
VRQAPVNELDTRRKKDKKRFFVPFVPFVRFVISRDK